MRQLLIPILLLSACSGGSDQQAGNSAAPVQPKAEVSATPAASNSLTGLFESGEERRNQLCLIEGEGGARFGLVVWGANDHSCSGVGSATRDGNRLTLSMTGDETCSIQAEFDGTTIQLPETLPDGCNYYCGARARMSGTSFARAGSTQADALKATDLVGEPLCRSQPS